MTSKKLIAKTIKGLKKKIAEYYHKYPIAGYGTIKDEIKTESDGFSIVMWREKTCD